MTKTRISGWLVGAALTASALWINPAGAVEMLYVRSFVDNYSCLGPGAGNSYYGEAWGYAQNGGITVKVCEVSQALSSIALWAGGRCTGTLGGAANRVKSVVTRRNTNTRAFVSLEAQDVLKTFSTGSYLQWSTPINTRPAGCSSPTITIASTGQTI